MRFIKVGLAVAAICGATLSLTMAVRHKRQAMSRPARRARA
jgi:hypothetical protein